MRGFSERVTGGIHALEDGDLNLLGGFMEAGGGGFMAVTFAVTGTESLRTNHPDAESCRRTILSRHGLYNPSATLHS